MDVRKRVFSEARFQFRKVDNGKTGDTFYGPELDPLQHPWPNGTEGDLLTRAIMDVDLAGNFYARKVLEGGVERLRPDWMTIILGSPTGHRLDLELAGYVYQPGGYASGDDPIVLLPEEVAHWAPIPDPGAWYRGMSWLVPIIREILGDSAAIAHKELFFVNGATPNMVVSLDPAIQKDVFEAWVEAFQGQTEGLENAYKTLYLGGGAQATVIGSDFKQMDFKETQGHGETRIAAAAGVPPIVVGLSEGLESATYSNYAQARRAFADATLRPLWRSFCSSMQEIISPPGNAMLWYDDSDISFLQEDQADKAKIQQTQAATAASYVAAGFESDSVVKAILADDMSLLKHSGLVSVQLLPPGEQKNVPPQLGPGNGNGNGTLPPGSKPAKPEKQQT